MVKNQKHASWMTEEQLRFLFAGGILTGSGKGNKRKVTFHRDKAQALHEERQQARGKPDHSATRAARLQAGHAQRQAVVSDKEIEKFRGAQAGRDRRAAHFASLAAKRRTEAAQHAKSSNAGTGRMGQPVNANSRARQEFRSIQRDRAHATKAYQASDKADHWDAKAQHARTAGLMQLRSRVQSRVTKQKLARADVGSTVSYLGEPYKVKKKLKNKIVLEHARNGVFHIQL